MTAGLYVRVSTQEQRKYGISVSNQIDALIEYCNSHGYDYVIYNDAGISARKKYTRRPALLKMLEDVKQGKIQILLVTRLDRFFRSVADYYAVNSVLEEYNVPWKAIWEDYTTETSDGVFKVNIMLSISQAEADRTSEKIKSVMEYKRTRGDYVGSAPVGYLVHGKDLVVDEECKNAMQAFWDVLYETKSITKAREAANSNGLYIQKNHAYKLIRRDAYHGDASNGYTCTPYISKDKHEEILRMVASRSRETKKVGLKFYYSGLCYCGVCGNRMSAKTVRRTLADGTTVYHKKYTCVEGETKVSRCPALNISEKKIEQFFLSNMEKVLDDVRIGGKLEKDESDRDYASELRNLNQKLNRIKILYEEGDTDIEEYRIKRDKIREEITAIELEMENHKDVQVPELPVYWRTIYESLDELHKAEFWHSIIEKIVITRETKDNPTVIFK